MIYKILSITLGTISIGAMIYHLLHSRGFIDYWIVIPVVTFNVLAIYMLWKLGTGVWISDKEYDDLSMAKELLDEISIEEIRHIYVKEYTP